MTRSVWLVLLAAALWGTTGTAAFGLGDQVSPLAIGAATMGCGGVILAITGGKQTLKVWADSGARRWLGWGILGVVVYPLTFYWGMALAGIAIGNVIALGLGPLAVAVLEWSVDRSKPGALWWGSSSVAVIGIVLMSMAEVELGAGRPSNVALGVLVATVAGLSYGLFTYVFGRLLDRGHTPRGVIGAVFGGGSPVLLVVLAITGAGLFGSWQNASIVAYLVLGPMVVAYLAFSRALQKVRSSTVATLALLEPVVATALAVLFVGERLGPLALVGGVAVLLSLALVSRASSERTPPKSAYS